MRARIWTGVPDECSPHDLNGDGHLDGRDIAILFRTWGACRRECPPSCKADLDSDCGVGLSDLMILLGGPGR